MKVELMQATENPGKFIADIASICYGKEEAANPQRLLETLTKLGHTSTLEHVYYTFKIEGISRACLGQMVRHRHTSPTVESQRYVGQADKRVVVPPTVKGDDAAMYVYEELVAFSKDTYIELRRLGIPKEDARYALPEGIETREYVSMNLRELLHMENLRVSKQAQWEIKNVVKAMVKLVIEKSPELKFMFKGEY